MANREEVLYQDFSSRLQPRPLWEAHLGTAMRVVDAKGNVTYRAKPTVQVQKHRPTEAEDNAAGRAHRRRHNRMLRGWRPYAKR